MGNPKGKEYFNIDQTTGGLYVRKGLTRDTDRPNRYLVSFIQMDKSYYIYTDLMSKPCIHVDKTHLVSEHRIDLTYLTNESHVQIDLTDI